MTEKRVYQALASAFDAYQNCIKSGNDEWRDKWEEIIKDIVDGYLPHGSGFDCGCTFYFTRSKPDKLVITTSYHHMNDVGMYDGWTDHTIIIRPAFVGGFDLRITGRDRNEFKDYAYQTFEICLSADYTE